MKTLSLTIVVALASIGPALAQEATDGQARVVKVSGVVALENKKEMRTAAVTMAAIDATGDIAGSALAARMYPDGAFFFVNVEPGRYLLKASGQSFDSSQSMFATQELTVGTTSIGDLYIILNRPMPPTPTVNPPETRQQAGFSSTRTAPGPAAAGSRDSNH
jgi:hypothetical protein